MKRRIYNNLFFEIMFISLVLFQYKFWFVRSNKDERSSECDKITGEIESY